MASPQVCGSNNNLKRNAFYWPWNKRSSFVRKHRPCLKMQPPFLEVLRPPDGQIKLSFGASIQFYQRLKTFNLATNRSLRQYPRTEIADKRIHPHCSFIYKCINKKPYMSAPCTCFITTPLVFIFLIFDFYQYVRGHRQVNRKKNQ